MKYHLTRGTQHNYIEDEQGNYLAKTFDTSRANTERLQQLIQQANAMSGVADPANAIAAAREALGEWVNDPAICVVVGLPAPVDKYCDCWVCERTRNTVAALALLEGVQP